jgi:uncharacterized protein (DUF1778 family)
VEHIMKDKRTDDIRVRVTPEEKKLILENAEKNEMKMSDYVRHVSLGTREVKLEVTVK